jgi:hypothetical protein
MRKARRTANLAVFTQHACLRAHEIHQRRPLSVAREPFARFEIRQRCRLREEQGRAQDEGGA